MDFNEAREYEEGQWHQLDHTQVICTSIQTDNHASTLSVNFLQARCSSWRPTNSVKALKAIIAANQKVPNISQGSVATHVITNGGIFDVDLITE